MAHSSPDIDFRILLIGRTGHGKSSTGNTIVGKDVFKVSSTSKSLTKTCQWSKKVNRFGRIVEVVDTPGIFDTDLSEREVHRELLKALALSTPGFHVIAFVLMKGRFTEEIQKTQEIFFDWFGEGVEKFACVILTDTDNEKAKDEFINNDPHEKLAHLVEACGENVVALNNKAPDEIKENQAKRIFEVIDCIKQSNKGEYFTNVAFQLAEKYVMNRYPQELTQDSILLLENARRNMKLSEKQCRYLDHTFKVTTEATTVTETDNDSMESSTGNLPIFDSSTNERISNIRKANQNEQVNAVTPSSLDATLPDTLSDSQRSLSSQVSEVPGKTAPKNTFYEPSLELEDEVSGSRKSKEIGSGSGQLEHNAKVRKYRKDRKYVPGSVSYDIPQSPVDDFKNRVNNEENFEELQGFSRYLRKAWRFCKRMCILL